MQIRELLSDDDAVSPVIGVILMVAITVILAAVIASFVLGLGNQTSATPQASFSFDYDGDGTGSGVLTVSHDGGDSIEAQELHVRGSGYDTSVNADITADGAWSSSSTYSATEMVKAGKSLTVGASSDYDLSIVYEPLEGDSSATLAKDTGPDA